MADTAVVEGAAMACVGTANGATAAVGVGGGVAFAGAGGEGGVAVLAIPA